MEKRLTNPWVPIALILIAAFGAICFTIGAAAFLYNNTRSLVASRQWVEHTQEVLLSIQRLSLFVDRVDSEAALYAATQNPSNLRAAQSNAIRMQTAVLHLRNLVEDNENQNANIQQLESSASELAQILSSPPDAALVKAQVLRCQQSLSLMTEQESQLLRERNTLSQEKAQRSIFFETGVALLSFLVLTLLFGFLLRDTLERSRIAKRWLATNEELEQSNKELADSMDRLKRHADETMLLAAFRDELQLCANNEQVYHSVAVRFPRLLAGTNGALCMMNETRHTIEMVSCWGESIPQLSEVFSPESCCGLRGGLLRWRSPQDSEIDCTHFAGTPPLRYVCIPLVAQGETLGILVVECPTDDLMKVVKDHTEGLQQLVQLTAMSHASIELRSKLEQQSIRDPLTGLYNRNLMQLALERELARAERRKSILAVLMIDVDHFKAFNDRFNHAAGDIVLKEVAKVLRTTARAGDVVCRYGGEEFTIILPDVTVDSALERAESARNAVMQLRTTLDNTHSVNISISIGVALFPVHAKNAESLLRQADNALYRAKHEGRNRTCIAMDEAVQLVSA